MSSFLTTQIATGVAIALSGPAIAAIATAGLPRFDAKRPDLPASVDPYARKVGPAGVPGNFSQTATARDGNILQAGNNINYYGARPETVNGSSNSGDGLLWVVAAILIVGVTLAVKYFDWILAVTSGLVGALILTMVIFGLRSYRSWNGIPTPGKWVMAGTIILALGGFLVWRGTWDGGATGYTIWEQQAVLRNDPVISAELLPFSDLIGMVGLRGFLYLEVLALGAALYLVTVLAYCWHAVCWLAALNQTRPFADGESILGRLALRFDKVGWSSALTLVVFVGVAFAFTNGLVFGLLDSNYKQPLPGSPTTPYPSPSTSGSDAVANPGSSSTATG